MSLIDPAFREQVPIKVGSRPMDMAFHGDELLVACQGDGTVHVIDIPARRAKGSFMAGQAAIPGFLLISLAHGRCGRRPGPYARRASLDRPGHKPHVPGNLEYEPWRNG